MKVSLGKPSERSDLIVSRRVEILKGFEDFSDPKARLLDFGCGNGGTMLALCSDFLQIDGIDVSEHGREEFETERDRMGIGNCRFFVKSVEEAAEMGLYERIVSFEVLEHLPDDLLGARIMNRLLKENGRAAVSVPNKWWIFETHGAYLPLLPWHRVPFFSWLPGPIHSRFAKARIYTKRRIERLMKDAGFEIVESVYVTAPMDAVKNRTLRNFLRRTVFRKPTTRLPFLSTSVLLHVQKRSEKRSR